MPPINSEATPAGIPLPVARATMVLPSVEYALVRTHPTDCRRFC